MAKQIAASRGGRDTSAGSPRVLNNQVTETRGCIWPSRPLCTRSIYSSFPRYATSRHSRSHCYSHPVTDRAASLGHPVLQTTLKGLPKLLFFVSSLACPLSVVPSPLALSSLPLPHAFPQACSCGVTCLSRFLFALWVYLQLVTGIIRRNVALTGSSEPRGKNQRTGHKHLWVSYRR
jgi:hypothetical protein